MRTPQGPQPRHPHTRTLGRVFGVSLLLACSGLAHAQTAGQSRPTASGRVVRAFDFEEQDFNPLPVPLGWIRAQDDPAVPRDRPGFPLWNGGVLDYQSPAYSGTGSVKLPTNGGSTSMVLRYGELSIFANADYIVSARVRTQGLKHANARLVATLLDQQGNELESSRSVSRPIRNEGQWEQVAIQVEGLEPNAAFMRIEMQLLQPEQQAQEDERERFTVWEQDFEGAAWFDDLIVAQLPRLELTTGTPGNIIIDSQSPPELQVLVRDLTGQDIRATIRIFDVHANLVQSETISDESRRVQRHWSPQLPGYGWYRALLEVDVDQQMVGVRTLDFIWASPQQHRHAGGMFSIDASITEPKQAHAAYSLVRGSGVDRAMLRIWDHETTQTDLLPNSMNDGIISRLLGEKIRLGFMLGELPDPLADLVAVDTHEVLDAFRDPNGDWTHWGAETLDQYGQRVLTWQFGERPTQEPGSKLVGQLQSARESLRGFVPGPIAAVPWPVDRTLPPELAVPGVALQVIDDNTTTPRAMGELVDQWTSQRTPSDSSDTPEPKLGMTLHPMYDLREQYGTQAWSAVGALARKAISFWWAASASDVDPQDFELRLSNAWWVSPGKRGQVMPAPELVVWRTLASHLGGRDASQELDLIPGVKMLTITPRTQHTAEPLADGQESRGGMILWLDEPTVDPVTLWLPLAQNSVRVYDILGNETVIEPSPMGNVGVPAHKIELTRSPIIVEDVNIQLVQFLAGLRLNPDTLEARSGIHKHALSITNPWPIPISGRVYIVEPGGYTSRMGDIDRTWEILPRLLEFSLSPNEQRLLPVDIAYSLGEIAGEKELVFDVELKADNDYPLLRVQRTIELELPGIEMNLSAKRNEAGITVVTATVINHRENDEQFEIIAIAPNEPRIRRSINALGPGQSTSRQFAFARPEPGERIIVSLLPRDTATRLNKAVGVP